MYMYTLTLDRHSAQWKTINGHSKCVFHFRLPAYYGDHIGRQQITELWDCPACCWMRIRVMCEVYMRAVPIKPLRRYT